MYRGESPGKKAARLCGWQIAKRFMDERGIPIRALVLASRETGDLAVLSALRAEAVTAVDLDEVAVEAAKRAYPAATVIGGNVVDVSGLPKQRQAVTAINLDWCGNVSAQLCHDTRTVLRRAAVSGESVLIVTHLNAREDKGRMKRYERTQCDALVSVAAGRSAVADGASAKEADAQRRFYMRCGTADQRCAHAEESYRSWIEQLPGVASVTGYDPEANVPDKHHVRQITLHRALAQEERCGIGVAPLAVVNYSSGTSPMMTTVYAVTRQGVFYTPKRRFQWTATLPSPVWISIKATTGTFKRYLNEQRHEHPGLLNMRPSSVAAWRAWDTVRSRKQCGEVQA